MVDPFSGSRSIIFDKYEIGKFLGKGTFAKVYHAKNINTSENVAIKVISKNRLKEQDIALIEREIAIMRLIRHPNIVEIKEVMATKRRIFFIIEYIKGGELFARVARGRLKEETARKYFQQLITAVDFCHSRGVYHRDLKPENLLLDENDNLKVSDFGLSALPEQLRADGLLHTQCGTPAYVAPEVLRNNGYDGAKADIWSCGVILFVLLAGFEPFSDENLMKMYKKIINAEVKFPDWFSPDAKRVISRLLVPDPALRITIQGIGKIPWFRRGFIRPFKSVTETMNNPKEEGIESTKSSTLTPPPYTAFQFISSMCSGFDLSNLFENRRKPGSIFASKCSAETAMEKIEKMGKDLKFKIVSNKDYKLRMQGAKEGRKGKLGVMVEIFEVASEVAVVEFSNFAGDTWEYRRFFEEEARPALKDIVWSWQGEAQEG